MSGKRKKFLWKGRGFFLFSRIEKRWQQQQSQRTAFLQKRIDQGRSPVRMRR